MAAVTRTIGILGFDDVTSLDLTGPADVFATASEIAARDGPAPYRLLVLGISVRPFRSDSGVVITPECALGRAPALDTLVIPGGAGLRQPGTNEALTRWLHHNSPRVRRIVCVCTGIYGLAPSGLLDGRQVTTHWQFAADVARKFPRLKVDSDAIFLKDGKFYTAAGVTSGIDLSLALVEEDLGAAVALSVARMLIVYMKRPGGQEQYSEPLRFQTEASDRFSALAAWISSHLGSDLSIEALAARTFVCARHFSRRFKAVFGVPPAEFVERLRLDEARRRLASGPVSVATVASSLGFTSADSFRRAFERRFGITPTGYRSRFGSGRLAS